MRIRFGKSLSPTKHLHGLKQKRQFWKSFRQLEKKLLTQPLGD
jgi:hypothetical protein